MSFSSVMQNLAIGIAGGIFSSIIVSIAFYILTNLQKEVDEAESLTEPIKMVCATWKYKEFLKSGLDVDETIPKYWEKSVRRFNKFCSTAFDDQLSNILSDMRDISLKSENIKNIQKKDFGNYVQQLSKQLELYELYKKNFAKIYMLRVLKNKVLWAIGIISILIFVAA